jgi:hypothetical protein
MRSARTAVSVGVIALLIGVGGTSRVGAEEPGKGKGTGKGTFTGTGAGAGLLAVIDADPLELARVVQRHGDRALLQLLAPATETLVRLAAVRASPWLRAPERALATLSEIASGRDSELAPAAARAALRIAQQLDAAVLARRECLPGELTPALVALRALGERETAAPHVGAYARAAAEQLAAAGVPLPAAK